MYSQPTSVVYTSNRANVNLNILNIFKKKLNKYDLISNQDLTGKNSKMEEYHSLTNTNGMFQKIDIGQSLFTLYK